jgi:hypothetical protein
MMRVANDIWILRELVTRGGFGSGPHFLIRPGRTSGYREVPKMLSASDGGTCNT